jgi:hypothetical protein
VLGYVKVTRVSYAFKLTRVIFRNISTHFVNNKLLLCWNRINKCTLKTHSLSHLIF